MYWIVNLVDRQVEVYTDPSGPSDLPHYRQVRIFGESDEVPLEIPGREAIAVPAGEVLP